MQQNWPWRLHKCRRKQRVTNVTLYSTIVNCMGYTMLGSEKASLYGFQEFVAFFETVHFMCRLLIMKYYPFMLIAAGMSMLVLSTSVTVS